MLGTKFRSTTTDLYTTYTSTAEELVRTTPQSTLTVTTTPAVSQAKRNAEAQITGRSLSQVDIDEVFQMFRRQNAASTSINPNVASLSSAFSSACSCRDYPGSTVTATYTDEPVVCSPTSARKCFANDSPRLKPLVHSPELPLLRQKLGLQLCKSFPLPH